MASQSKTAADLLDRYGQTYAEEAGIKLADKPARLYQLAVLSTLLSARISASVAVAAAREFVEAGMTTPRRMADATWQQRVDALGRGHYRRYDERTATMLGDGAELVQQRWGGDLRKMHASADGVDGVRAALGELPGIGAVGQDIFCREVQAVWPELRPYVDKRAAAGAQKAGLPTDPKGLAKLVSGEDVARLIAALVRVSLDKSFGKS